MGISIKPRSAEIEHILDRLTKYPLVKVDTKLSQELSKYKKIRYLSKLDNIYIKKGIIGIPPQVKLKRKGNLFYFEYK